MSALGGVSYPPSVKLPTTPGGRISGTIVELPEERQAMKFQNPAERAARAPRVPDFWPARDGKPAKAKMQQPVILQLDPGFQRLDANDTGLRTLYVTEGDPRSRAFRAYTKTNRVVAQVGFHLVLEFIGSEAGQGSQPKQVWQVVSLGQAPATGGALGGGEDFPDETEVLEGELVGAGVGPVSTEASLPRSRRPGARATAGPPSGGSSI